MGRAGWGRGVPHTSSPGEVSNETGDADPSLLGGNGDKGSCKILLPLMIAEQGLNAHLHLVQLLGFSQAFNRTLVLPNIGKIGVGACRRWRFGVYYDERVLLSKLDDENSGCVSQ